MISRWRQRAGTQIGELCRSFEEMRQRLKDSAEEKIASEKESRALISNIAHEFVNTSIHRAQGICGGHYGRRGRHGGEAGSLYPYDLQ